MNIHEHQGKELLGRYGIPVPRGQACFTVDEAVRAAEALGFPCVVKAQIHAGGRGKAGGVKVVRDARAAVLEKMRAAHREQNRQFGRFLGFSAGRPPSPPPGS